jgi:hypothetical protein
MANKILLRRNSTANAAPTSAQIEPGELAINTADGRLYTELTNGTVVNLPVKSIEGQAISPLSVTTTNSLDTPNVRAKVYGTADLNGATNGWYPLFPINENQVITCSLRTLYHSSALFTVSTGYLIGAISVLHWNRQYNGAYANIAGIRINNGVVEIQLNWSSGPSVQIAAQISGAGSSLPVFYAALNENTTTPPTGQIWDSVTYANGTQQTRFKNLDLDGNLTFSTSTNRISWDNGTEYIARNGDSLEFGTQGSSRLFINSSGDMSVGTSASTRITTNSTLVSAYYLAETNPRWQISRDLVGSGLAGYGAIPANSTLAAAGVAFGLAASRELGLYTSNGSTLAERVRVDNNGLVGINTNDPQDRLHLNGSQTTLRLQSGTSYDTQVRMIDSESDWSIGVNVANSAGRGKFVIRSNTASAYRFVITDNGNVGIGTTSPATLLHVSSTADLQTTFEYTTATAGFNVQVEPLKLLLNASSGLAVGSGVGLDFVLKDYGEHTGARIATVRTDTSNNQALTFWTGGESAPTEKMRITHAGYVGIGTTTPTAPLTLRADAGTVANPGVVIEDMIAFKAYYTGYDEETVKAAIGSGVDGLTNWNTRNGLLTFSTSSGGTLTEQMRIMSDGQVGIGETDPAVKLDIKSAGGFGLRINNTNAGGHYWAIGAADSGFSSGNDRLLFIPNSVSSSTSAKIAFKTDGSIGANTYDPQAKVHAYDSTTFSAASVKLDTLILSAGGGSGIGARHGIQFRANGLTDNIRVAGIYQTCENTSSNSTGLAFHTSNWTSAGTYDQERVRITNAGDVGIGVTSPGSRLVVKGSGTTSATSALSVTGSSDGSILFARNDGYVGIGTTTPTARFTVIGTGTGTAEIGSTGHGGNYTGICFNGTGNTNVGTNIFSSPTDPTLYINRPSGSPIKFREANADQVFIASGGSVGINTTIPQAGYKLDVNGAAVIRGAIALSGTITEFGNSRFQLNAGTGSAAHSYACVGNGNFGVGTTTPGYKLEVNGSFAATTKSFRIAHPSKPNHILEYGSLESPYHGVRLTGRGKVTGVSGQVTLPEYLKDLVHDDERLTIQITNYRHGKLLYVSAIDLQHDAFFVACDISSDTDLEFFWCLTAVRKDIEEMVVERPAESGF